MHDRVYRDIIVSAVPFTVLLHSILISPIGLLDLENVGLAVEISFLSHLQAEILMVPVRRPPFWILHCRFPLPVSLYHIFISPVGELITKI